MNTSFFLKRTTAVTVPLLYFMVGWSVSVEGAGATGPWPTDMPSRSGVFEEWVMASAPVIEPMVAVGGVGSVDEEDSELEKALFVGEETNVPARIEEFTQRFPRSRWRPVIELNLGHYSFSKGRFSKALGHFREAYGLAKSDDTKEGRHIAAAAAAQLSRMYARLGRMEDLDPLLKEASRIESNGATGQILGQSEDALETMAAHPGISFKCGPLALARVRERLGMEPPFHQVIHEAQSPWRGFSLAEVSAMAAQMGMGFVGVKAPANFGEVPVPSVVHWRLNHYAAIVDKVGDRYLVKDLTFGFDGLMSADALREEASGYFVVSQDAIPAGWNQVSEQEAWNVFGRGYITVPEPNAVTPDDITSGPVVCPKGMAAYTFYTMMVSLGIHDVPLGYAPPAGPRIDLAVRYNQTETVQPATINFGNLGRLWGHNWSAWVEKAAGNPTATVVLRGGGAETYTLPAVDGNFSVPNPKSRARLRMTGTNVFERVLPDGSREIYGVAQNLGGGQSRVFLSALADSSGNEVGLAYDGSYRLITITDAIGQTTTFVYGNAAHPYLVTKVSDPFGRHADFSHDGSGQLVRITDVEGIASEFTYGSSDFIDSLKTPYGITHFELDTGGNSQRILTATDPLGMTEKLEFNAQVASLSIPSDQQVPSMLTAGGDDVPFLMATDFTKNRNSFYWDKKAYGTDPDNRSNAVVYHWLHSQAGRLSSFPESIKKPLEARVFFNYAEQTSALYEPSGAFLGLPTKTAQVVNVAGSNNVVALRQSDFNAIGKPTRIVDPLGRQTVLTYATNLVDLVEVKQKKAGGGFDVLFAATYNSKNLPLTVTGADGGTTSFGWNARGQVTAVTNALAEVTTYTYATNGYLLSMDPPLTGTLDVITLTYDAYGRVQTRTQWGYTLTYQYDKLDRITKVTYPDASTEEVIYEAMHARWLKDRKGQWTRRDVNGIQQVVGELNPAGEYTAFEWCKCGDLKAIIDAQGQATRWTHDVGGRKTSKKYADGRTDTYTYNPFSGWLETVTDAAGQQQKPEYAVDGRVTAMRYVNETVATPDVTWGWDPFYPRMINMVDGTGTTTYTYRAAGTAGAGALATVDGPLTNDTLTLGYDALGRNTSRTLGGAAQGAGYDALGRVLTVTNALDTFTVAYNATNGLAQSVSGTAGLVVSNSFYGATNDFRVQGTTHTWGGTQLLAQFGYQYDVLGRITQWDQQVGAGDPRRVVPEYDRVSRLLRALTSNPSTSQQTGAEANRYDPVGNKLTRQTEAEVVSGTFNVVNQLQALSSGGEAILQGQLDEPGTVAVGSRTVKTDPQNRFALSVPVTTGANTLTLVSTDVNTNSTTNTATFTVAAAGSRTFSYDVNGFTTNDGSRTYDWDGAGRLVKIGHAGAGNRTEFTYDGLSRRVGLKEVTNNVTAVEQRFVYDGLGIAERRAADGTTVERRYYGQGFEQVGGADAGRYFYVRDHLGSIRALVDDSGTLRGQWAYSLWGSRGTNEVTANPVESDFGYTGHLEHGRSGLVFALYRAYDPSIARWLSPDPIGEEGGINLYGYVLNNPVNLWDPRGLDPSQSIVIDLDKDTLTVYDKDKNTILTSDIVHGGENDPKTQTSVGDFKLGEWQTDKTSKQWGSATATKWSESIWGGNAYGPYFVPMIGTDGEGIHGTMGMSFGTWWATSRLSPTSHGCIRIPNDNIVKLHDSILKDPAGTPVRIIKEGVKKR
jgi:RHS repeat-associated protein